MLAVRVAAVVLAVVDALAVRDVQAAVVVPQDVADVAVAVVAVVAEPDQVSPMVFFKENFMLNHIDHHKKRTWMRCALPGSSHVKRIPV